MKNFKTLLVRIGSTIAPPPIRRTLRSFSLCATLLLTTLLSTGNVWAADEVKVTFDFATTASADWGIPTSGTNTKETSFTKDGYTIKLSATTNYKQNSGYLILGKNGSTLTMPAFSWTTTKILVYGHSGASGSVKQNIFVGETAVSTETTGANNVTNTYEINSDYQAAGNIYVFKVTSAHNTQIDSIEIYGPASTTPEIAFQSEGNAITELDFGTVELNSGYVSKTFTLVGANLTNGVRLITNNGALWSVSPTALILPESDGTINKTITVYISTDKANGVTAGVKDSYLYAEWADDPKPEGSKNDTLQLLCELVEPVPPTDFSIDPDIVSLEPGQTEQLSTKGWLPMNVTNTAVTWESDDESIATVDANGLVTAVATGFATITATSVADPSITATRNIEVKAHVVAPGAYDIVPNSTFFNTTANGSITGDAADLTYSGTQNDITVTYAKGSQSNMYINGSQTRVYNGSVMTFSVPAGFAITAIAFTADGDNWVGVHTADVGNMTDNKNWAGNANSVTITFRGTCRITNIKVTYAIASAVATPTISGETPFLGTTTVSMNCATDGTTIYYTTDGSDPTNESTPYTAAFTIDATTTIKAIAYDLGEHSAVETKTFTKATIYSVEDALGVIDALNEGAKTPDSVYVTGYVKSISEIDVESYFNATYLIQDAGVNHELTVFRGKNMNNTDFTSEDQLQVGQLLIIKGILQKYKNSGTGVITPEFIQGNYIVERVPKGGVASIALGGELTKTSGYEAGDNISVAGLTAIATYANGFMEDVTAEAVWTIDGDAEGTILSASEQHTIRATYEGKYAEDAYDFEANEHAVTFADPANGSLVIKYAGSPITTGDEFTKNSVLTVEVTPDTGYQLETLTANGDDIKDTKSFTVVTENVVVAATFAEIQHVYSVVGNGAVIATGWDETATETEMTLNAGVYSYKVQSVVLQAGTNYEYKIVEDHSWDVSFPQDGNASFTVDKDGRYDVTFTLNESTKAYAASPELKEEILLNRKFAVLGDFNGWSATAVEVAPDAATASFVVNFDAAGDKAFKVQVNGAWLSNASTYHRAHTGASDITENNSNNMTLQVDLPGEYTFTWTYATNALEITFPALPTYTLTLHIATLPNIGVLEADLFAAVQFESFDNDPDHDFVMYDNGTLVMSGEFVDGTVVDFENFESQTYKFVKWSDDESTTFYHGIDIDQNKEVTMYVTPITFDAQIASHDVSKGTVEIVSANPLPMSEILNPSSTWSFTVNAIPAQGYKFLGWGNFELEKAVGENPEYDWYNGAYKTLEEYFAEKHEFYTSMVDLGDALTDPDEIAHRDYLSQVFSVSATFTAQQIAVDYEDITLDLVNEKYTLKAFFTEDSGTAIGNTADDVQATKVIENNQLIIIKNGVKYTISGSKIR